MALAAPRMMLRTCTTGTEYVLAGPQRIGLGGFASPSEKSHENIPWGICSLCLSVHRFARPHAPSRHRMPRSERQSVSRARHARATVTPLPRNLGCRRKPPPTPPPTPSANLTSVSNLARTPLKATGTFSRPPLRRGSLKMVTRSHAPTPDGRDLSPTSHSSRLRRPLASSAHVPLFVQSVVLGGLFHARQRSCRLRSFAYSPCDKITP